MSEGNGSGVGLDVQWLEEMLLGWVEWAAKVPILSLVVNYIAASLHHDPWRLFLEAAMLVVLVRYLFGRRYRPKDNPVKLTKKEVDDLIEEWQPEPLVPALSERYIREMNSIPVIEGPSGIIVKIDGKEKLNFATYDFLGLVGHKGIEEVAKKTLRNYGVGSCGPPGFYGTIDVHMELEKKIAQLLGTEEAILYSYGFSTIASTIPAFAKRGDLIVCDENIGFALQKGVLVSRAQVKYFKHNDMEDLEKILKEIKAQDQKTKKRLNRRFIVTEGLFQYQGDICPLPELVKLKYKYKYRLIVDETLSFGILGKTGRGVCEHFNVAVADVDILTGCLANSIAAAGGYCAGSTAVVDHQRLSGQGYCYSASMPALLAASAIEGLDILVKEPSRVQTLRTNTETLRKLLDKIPLVSLRGSPVSPLIFIELKKHFSDRETEENLLQDIVNDVLADGVLVSRMKLIIEEEIFPPPPSIQVCVSQSHTEENIVKAATLLTSAFAKHEARIKSA